MSDLTDADLDNIEIGVYGGPDHAWPRVVKGADTLRLIAEVRRLRAAQQTEQTLALVNVTRLAEQELARRREEAARRDERETCARLAETRCAGWLGTDIAAAIRARGTT